MLAIPTARGLQGDAVVQPPGSPQLLRQVRHIRNGRTGHNCMICEFVICICGLALLQIAARCGSAILCPTCYAFRCQVEALGVR
jgi:hypothetical protein